VSNIYEQFQGESERYSVTTALNVRPCTRSIFILEKFIFNKLVLKKTINLTILFVMAKNSEYWQILD
jgi:hypothetical protein